MSHLNRFFARLSVFVAVAIVAQPAFADEKTFHEVRTQVQCVIDTIDSSSSSGEDISITARREGILKGTKDGIALIKKIIANDSLTKVEKQVLIQDVAGEIGFAYYEAVSAQVPASMLPDPDVLEPKGDEKRWSPRFWKRTWSSWLQVSLYGIARDVFLAFSPLMPTNLRNGIPEGWVAADAAAEKQAKDTAKWEWRMPSILPALNVTDHAHQLPLVGKWIPKFLVSSRVDRWALEMVNLVKGHYDFYKEKEGEDHQLGIEATTIILEDYLAPVDADGMNDSRTIADGASHRYQRWLYVVLGAMFVKYGWDFVDAGSQYVTQTGVLLSRIMWGFLSYSMVRVRNVSSTVEAYKVLQPMINDLIAREPQMFDSDHTNELRGPIDELRARYCESKAAGEQGEGALPIADASKAKPKKKKKPESSS